ncbi:YgcG family protein [Psychrobacter sp.]|uniref:TPM domain-containing protein n=1 Tax=Psychrobacter sp. TaxID=56811 RepID=UPI0025D89C27|nr:TPM domain-containing protein [Psychrobacter sp.]
MQKLKHSWSILSLIGATLLVTPVSFAANNEATSVGSSQTTKQYSDQSIDDMVAVAKAGQQNEAINDAVLGNDAITDNIPNIGQATAEDNTKTAAPSTNNPPRQSTAPSVDNDKLILNSPVVDQANIFTPQEKQLLTQRLRHIYDQGLAQAAVVTVPSTNGMDIFDYSMQVAEKWKLGNKDTDDGLLILVAVNDRNIYILSGYGLEGVLPDAALNRIIDDEIKPSFKQGDYSGGLIKGINRIEERLVADPDVLAQSDALAKERAQAQNQSSGNSPSIFGSFLIALIFGLFLTSVLGRIIGSFLATGGFAFMALSAGAGLITTVLMAVFLWLFLISRGGGGKGGGKGGRGGGVIFFPGGGFGGGGSGGFGGGGFGGGGFGGGGGGFGGGGAGGSW